MPDKPTIRFRKHRGPSLARETRTIGREPTPPADTYDHKAKAGYAVYSSPRWEKLSYELRGKHPYCKECGSTNNLQVDHIKPLFELGPKPEAHPLAWSPSNLQVLCAPCHAKKDAQARKEKREADFQAGLDLGWLES